MARKVEVTACYRLVTRFNAWQKVRASGGFRDENPATCCRFVADVLPIKSLTMNTVADVADFQSYHPYKVIILLPAFKHLPDTEAIIWLCPN
jgi:hypothetical protein